MRKSGWGSRGHAKGVAKAEGKKKYYGGMNRWQELYDIMQRANVIVEVVDARDPEGTKVLTAERWTDKEHLLVVANKADLLPRGKRLPAGTILVSAKNRAQEARWKLLRAVMGKTKERPVKALFIGYPNVGKSSIINMLARRKAAKVSPVAGTTKSEQWVAVNEELMVTDYRGVYPETESRSELVRKGAVNFQNDAQAYAHDTAMKVLRSKRLMAWIEKTYGISLQSAKTSEDVLAIIAKRRGWILKGGELNMEEAAKSLLRSMREAPEI
jgi:ribosome biogenesis GTPase A